MNTTKTLPSFLRTLATITITSFATLSAQTIDFDSDEWIDLESGWVANTDPSGFTAAERALILQKVNDKLAEAGISLTATEGSTDPCRIIISDSQAPPVPGAQGNETDVGAGGDAPAVVFMAEHPDATDEQHIEDIANSIKALIAAKHGAGANSNLLTDVMTRLQGLWRFTNLAFDTVASTQLQLNAGIPNAMTEPTARPTDVRYTLDDTPGRRLHSLDVVLTYFPGQQWNSSFGHLRADGTFVTFGKQGLLQVAPASFFFDGSGVDFAIELSDGTVCSLSNGMGRVQLVQPNPGNFEVYDRIDLEFDVNADRVPDATIQLDVVGNGAGGFYTRYYPGTEEDLFLTGSINMNAAWLAAQRAQVAQAGDIFYPRIQSFEGQFDGAPVFLVGELFTVASPVVPIDFPGLQFSAFAHFVLMSGNIGPAGFLGSLPIPPGLFGYHLLMQGLAVHPWAGNGIFGATDAMTLSFL